LIDEILDETDKEDEAEAEDKVMLIHQIRHECREMGKEPIPEPRDRKCGKCQAQDRKLAVDKDVKKDFA
jgi:hypothetical protein